MQAQVPFPQYLPSTLTAHIYEQSLWWLPTPSFPWTVSSTSPPKPQTAATVQYSKSLITATIIIKMANIPSSCVVSQIKDAQFLYISSLQLSCTVGTIIAPILGFLMKLWDVNYLHSKSPSKLWSSLLHVLEVRKSGPLLNGLCHNLWNPSLVYRVWMQRTSVRG